MKKVFIIIIVGLFFYTRGMEKEQRSYLEQLPLELKTLLLQFITKAELNSINTLEELLKKLQELSTGPSLSVAQDLYNNLQTIQKLPYDDALKATKEFIQKLSKKEPYISLFNNPDFNRIIISSLLDKVRVRPASGWPSLQDIIKELNTPGAQEWGRQLDFIAAADRGDLNGVRQSLASGINVNAKDMYGNTALIKAAEKGHRDIVEVLLKAGANVNAKDRHGDTALHFNVEGPERRKTVELLLAKGADVNAQDSYGRTPLMISTLIGDRGIIKALIERGADVNVQSDEGYTALMLAANYGYKDIVQLLIEAGADIALRNEEGRTAFDIARQRGYMGIIELPAKG